MASYTAYKLACVVLYTAYALAYLACIYTVYMVYNNYTVYQTDMLHKNECDTVAHISDYAYNHHNEYSDYAIA